MKVMTFNLKFASSQSPNSWDERRPVMRELIKFSAPDIIGTQEGFFHQICDINDDCPDYSWVGLGRNGGSHGEFCAIFYRTSRYKLLEFDHFWLSDTPDTIGSISWGHHCVRMATWAKFRNISTNNEFYLLNTHLDHEIQIAKEKGASLILALSAETFDPSLPVIITGDFNAIATVDPVYSIFTKTGGFTDTWFAADELVGADYATYHGYKTPEPGGPHIDWILAKGKMSVKKSGILDYSIDGQYPSDHCPVFCELQFTP